MPHVEGSHPLVATNPDILGGTPVFKGTRVPVRDVAANRAAGFSDAEIFEAYPSIAGLAADVVDQAVAWSKANPGAPLAPAPPRETGDTKGIWRKTDEKKAARRAAL